MHPQSLRKLSLFLSLLLSLSGASSFAKESEKEDGEAYWDYGIGLGAVHYEHYPSSNQFSDIALPGPTFQYRGKILRADDRDGAHLYLLKSQTFTVELAGAGYPALDSSNNRAREGMPDLPWMIALGPELVFKPNENWRMGLGVFQAISTDFKMTRFAGNIFEAKIKYQWDHAHSSWSWISPDLHVNSRVTLSFQSGDKKFQALYFEVTPQQATAERPSYEAREGFLSEELSYYQTFKSGRLSLFAGGSLKSYANSVNRESSLHKSDFNVTAVLGVNYVLGESRRLAVPEDDTSGVINVIKQRNYLKDSLE